MSFRCQLEALSCTEALPLSAVSLNEVWIIVDLHGDLEKIEK